MKQIMEEKALDNNNNNNNNNNHDPSFFEVLGFELMALHKQHSTT
jgi:hypothetical protein